MSDILGNVNDPDVSAAPSVAGSLGNVNDPGVQSVDEFNQAKFGTPTQQALTVTEGLGHGFAGPVSTGAEALLAKAGVPGLSPEEQEARASANPVEHYGSELTGFGLGAFTGTGEAGLLAHIGEGAAEASGVANVIGRAGIKAGAELAALQTGDEASKFINENPNQTLGSAAINIGLSGILGGAGGAALGSVSPIFKTLAKKSGIAQLASDFMNETARLQGTPEPGTLFQPAEAEDFIKARNQSSRPGFLAPKTAEDFQGHQIFMSPDGAGYSISPEGDLQNVFNNSGKKGAGADAVIHAIGQGAKTLDAFDGYLPQYYNDFGFNFKNSLEWDNQYAPRNWDYAKYGRPDVVFMEYPESLSRDAGEVRTRFDAARAERAQGFTDPTGPERHSDVPSSYGLFDRTQGGTLDQGAPATSTQPVSPNRQTLTPGAALAQWANQKGAQTLARAAGETAAGTVGGLAGSLAGHPLVGAYIGDKILTPIFSALAKPFAEKAVNAEAMKTSVDYLANAVKGDAILSKSVKDFFGTGKIIPSFLLPDDNSRASLTKSLENVQNPDQMLQVGGNIGHYMPAHGAAAGALAAEASNYLNTLKPKTIQTSPLDAESPPDKIAQAKYDRALDVAQQPLLVLQHAKEGTLLPQDVQTLNTIYPGLHSSMVQKINDELIEQKTKGTPIPYSQRITLSMLTGSTLDSTMTPSSMQAIIRSQANQISETQNVGKAKPTGAQLKAIEKSTSLYPTALQQQQIQKRK